MPPAAPPATVYHSQTRQQHIRILPAHTRHARSLYSLISQIEYARSVPFNLFQELQRTSYHYYLVQTAAPPPLEHTARRRGLPALFATLKGALTSMLYDSPSLHPDADFIATAGIQLCPDQTAKIHCIGVTQPYLRAKIGSLLMLRLLRQATAAGTRTVTLELHTDNAVAAHFYTQFGFAKTGTITDYYADGEDALAMQLTGLQAEATQQHLSRLTQKTHSQWTPTEHR